MIEAVNYHRITCWTGFIYGHGSNCKANLHLKTTRACSHIFGISLGTFNCRSRAMKKSAHNTPNQVNGFCQWQPMRPPGLASCRLSLCVFKSCSHPEMKHLAVCGCQMPHRSLENIRWECFFRFCCKSFTRPRSVSEKERSGTGSICMIVKYRGKQNQNKLQKHGYRYWDDNMKP